MYSTRLLLQVKIAIRKRAQDKMRKPTKNCPSILGRFLKYVLHFLPLIWLMHLLVA
jgi:hypothetical protein